MALSADPQQIPPPNRLTNNQAKCQIKKVNVWCEGTEKYSEENQKRTAYCSYSCSSNLKDKDDKRTYNT